MLPTNSNPKIERTNILGVGISAINMPQALTQIEYWINNEDRQYVCVRDVHGVVESQREERLRKIHNAAGMVTPDGMPLVWINHLYGKQQVSRVYGPDLLLAVCEHSIAAGWSHYFYGSGPGVVNQLVERLSTRYQGLRVVGMTTPPFRPLTAEEDQSIVKQINAANPQVLWVGLSTPKQEYWMADHLGRINVPVMIGVGAAFDFHAGVKKQAPRWMQRSGIEWFYRLASEPRRLWRRYLIDNPLFLWLLFLQLSKLRKFDLER